MKIKQLTISTTSFILCLSTMLCNLLLHSFLAWPCFWGRIRNKVCNSGSSCLLHVIHQTSGPQSNTCIATNAILHWKSQKHALQHPADFWRCPTEKCNFLQMYAVFLQIRAVVLQMSAIALHCNILSFNKQTARVHLAKQKTCSSFKS